MFVLNYLPLFSVSMEPSFSNKLSLKIIRIPLYVFMYLILLSMWSMHLLRDPVSSGFLYLFYKCISIISTFIFNVGNSTP